MDTMCQLILCIQVGQRNIDTTYDEIRNNNNALAYFPRGKHIIRLSLMPRQNNVRESRKYN